MTPPRKKAQPHMSLSTRSTLTLPACSRDTSLTPRSGRTGAPSRVAYLEEISSDGEVAIRAHGRLRASHRRLGIPAYDDLGLPWHRSFREDYLPMEPGVPAELRFDLLPTSTIVQRGVRLRFVITGADPRQRHFMRADPPPVVTLHLGGSTPSFIDLPVVP